MKRWTQIFKALANINRLKIIRFLSSGEKLHVTDIKDEIGISLGAVSKHLIILHNLDILENCGKDGHVFYFLNRGMPKDLRRTVSLFLNKK